MEYSALNTKELTKFLNESDLKLCPYHYTRSIINDVNIVLAPYNYILDENIRKCIGLDVK